MSIDERVAVLETKVDNLEVKIDDLREEQKEKHSEIKGTLESMALNSTKQHKELGEKLNSLENNKSWLQGMLYALGPVLMFVATQVDWKHLFK